jgi:hypothetical protein
MIIGTAFNDDLSLLTTYLFAGRNAATVCIFQLVARVSWPNSAKLSGAEILLLRLEIKRSHASHDDRPRADDPHICKNGIDNRQRLALPSLAREYGALAAGLITHPMVRVPVSHP